MRGPLDCRARRLSHVGRVHRQGAGSRPAVESAATATRAHTAVSLQRVRLQAVFRSRKRDQRIVHNQCLSTSRSSGPSLMPREVDDSAEERRPDESVMFGDGTTQSSLPVWPSQPVEQLAVQPICLACSSSILSFGDPRGEGVRVAHRSRLLEDTDTGSTRRSLPSSTSSTSSEKNQSACPCRPQKRTDFCCLTPRELKAVQHSCAAVDHSCSQHIVAVLCRVCSGCALVALHSSPPGSETFE